MIGLLRDAGIALRGLRRRWGFALAAVLSLGMAAALDVVIFGVVNAVVLRPPPYPDPDRIYTVQDPRTTPLFVSRSEYVAVRERSRSFERVGAFRAGMGGRHLLALEGEARRAVGLAATGTVLQALGVWPALGRPLLPEDERRGSAPVVVIGDRLWHQLGGTPAVLGRTLRIDRRLYAVVGVMPPGFAFPFPETEFWTALPEEGLQVGEEDRSLSLVGRLRSGTPPERAATELRTIAAQLDQALPLPGSRRRLEISSLSAAARPTDAPVLFAFQAAVGVVLLVACANVSNLLLARAVERSGEMRLRASLGATRWHLVRPLLAESAVLAAAAATIGLALAALGMKVMSWALRGGGMDVLELSVDMRVVAFTGLVAVISLFGIGLLPALRGSRATLSEALKGASHTVTAGGRDRFAADALIAAQLGLSLTLLVGAAAVTGTLAQSRQAGPAFDWHRMLTMNLRRSTAGDATARVGRPGLLPVVLVALRAAPEVEGVAATAPALAPEGTVSSASVAAVCDCMAVTPGYFEVLRLPLTAGRTFAMSVPTEAVAIVDEEMARRLWPGESAVGKQIKLGPVASRQPWRTVIGVAHGAERGSRARAKSDGSPPRVYIPGEPSGWDGARLLVRTRGRPEAALPAARRAILAADPGQPVFELRTMEAELLAALRPLQWCSLLFGAFAAAGLGLAAVGLYGVVLHRVTSQAREIGIRRAIGAGDWALTWLVLRGAGRPVAVGVLLGAAGGVTANWVLPAVLEGVSPASPAAWTAAMGLLVLTALLATAHPLRRTLRVAPAHVLRDA